MRRKMIKLGVFFTVFVISLVIASKIMNRGNTDMTMEMQEASIPIVYMNVNDNYINCLHGYMKPMEGNYLRESLTPLMANRMVSFRAYTYGTQITKVAYEVRSLDMERLIEDTLINNYTTDQDGLVATVPIKDLIEDDKEYMLIIKLTTNDGNELRYYTRIINSAELYLGEKMKFVSDFSDKTFHKEEAKELIPYMESNAEGDNTSFAKVNIHSSFDQLTYGNLNPIVISNKDMTLLEIDSENANISLSYWVQVKQQYYKVKEYFRLRRGSERMYLMEYERTMNQVLIEDPSPVINGKIVHGILEGPLQAKENTDANIYCFVQEGALYSFNSSSSSLAKVYSFWDQKNNDARTRYDANEIKILDLDEAGNIWFIVYGYHNRGVHEGQVGITMYYYDSMVNTIEEKLYIPYTKSSQLLKDNMTLLSYINKRGMFYVYIDGSIYNISLESRKAECVESNLRDDRFVSSKDNSIIAWVNAGDLKDCQVIQLFNLDQAAPTMIGARNGEIVLPLGFMDSDFIYGQARLSDVTTDASGRTIVPMYSLKIQNAEGELLKEYKQEGIYVTDIKIVDNMIILDRVVYDEERAQYEMTEPDQIMNNKTETTLRNVFDSVVTEEMETTYQTVLRREPVSDSIKNLTPKQVIFEGSREVVLDNADEEPRYYVYRMGELQDIYSDPADAVYQANEIFGVVVDKKCAYIWQSGARKSKTAIEDIETPMLTEDTTSVALCVGEILKKNGVYKDVSELLRTGSVLTILQDNIQGQVLDLHGCTLKSVLYYVNRGYPVMAMVEGGQAVLIVGYDAKNIILYDPREGRQFKKGMNDSTQWFEENNNRYITYIPD